VCVCAWTGTPYPPPPKTLKPGVKPVVKPCGRHVKPVKPVQSRKTLLLSIISLKLLVSLVLHACHMVLLLVLPMALRFWVPGHWCYVGFPGSLWAPWFPGPLWHTYTPCLCCSGCGSVSSRCTKAPAQVIVQKHIPRKQVDL